VKGPGPHPPPPADLPARRLALRAYKGPFFRVHRAALGPLFFGKTGSNRFDAPAAEFGVLYLAQHPRGAFVETFGHETGTRLLAVRELEERSLAELRTTRPLSLVDLTGKGLARIGADGRLLDGDYLAAQAWAKGLHDHPARPDGIAYRSRHDPSQVCAAVFERARGRVALKSTVRWDDESLRPLLIKLLDLYAFGIA
jgi:hypothetical protein